MLLQYPCTVLIATTISSATFRAVKPFVIRRTVWRSLSVSENLSATRFTARACRSSSSLSWFAFPVFFEGDWFRLLFDLANFTFFALDGDDVVRTLLRGGLDDVIAFAMRIGSGEE